MRIEIPELKRCCCCLPLRRGLITWIYLKMVIGVLLVVQSCYVLINLRRFRHGEFHLSVACFIMFMALLEIVFSTMFLISAHRKIPDYMRIYYRYSIGLLIFEVLNLLGACGLVIYLCIQSLFMAFILFHLMLEMLCFVVIQIGLQAYLVILVRSEMLKLENNMKFEFVNHTIEPECNVEITA